MKRACSLLLCAAIAGTGCVTFPPLWPDNKPAPATTAVIPPSPLPPAVAPEQISDVNAKAMAAALQNELDHEAQPMPANPVNQGKKP